MARARKFSSFDFFWHQLATTITSHEFDEPIELKFHDEKQRDHYYYTFYSFRSSLEKYVKDKINQDDPDIGTYRSWHKALQRCRLMRKKPEVLTIDNVNKAALTDINMDLMDQLAAFGEKKEEKGKESFVLEHGGKEYMVDFDPREADNVPLVMEFINGLERGDG